MKAIILTGIMVVLMAAPADAAWSARVSRVVVDTTQPRVVVTFHEDVRNLTLVKEYLIVAGATSESIRKQVIADVAKLQAAEAIRQAMPNDSVINLTPPVEPVRDTTESELARARALYDKLEQARLDGLTVPPQDLAQAKADYQAALNAAEAARKARGGR